MSRKFIAAIVAGAIAVTGMTSAPAKADNDRLQRFLLGATALVIIGTAVSKNKRDRHVTEPRHRHSQYWHHNSHRHHRSVAPHRHARPHRISLPGRCLHRHRTDRGRVTIYGRHCLRANGVHLSNLPRHCKRTVHAYRGTFKGYSPRCIANYRTASR